MADDDVPPGFTAKATKPEEKAEDSSKAVDNLASGLAVSAKVGLQLQKKILLGANLTAGAAVEAAEAEVQDLSSVHLCNCRLSTRLALNTQQQLQNM
jgi:hypothetical protein